MLFQFVWDSMCTVSLLSRMAFHEIAGKSGESSNCGRLGAIQDSSLNFSTSADLRPRNAMLSFCSEMERFPDGRLQIFTKITYFQQFAPLFLNARLW